jgi:hypothetical protein
MLRLPPKATVGDANDFEIVGAPAGATVTLAVFDVVPVPPSVEPIALVVLFFTPDVAPVTVTVIVQFAPAASVPPVNVRTLHVKTRLRKN